MRFGLWRREKGLTQQQCADALGCDQSFISQIERADEPQVPRSADFLRAVYVFTEGAVSPNDFYDIASWDADRREASADRAASEPCLPGIDRQAA